MEKLAKMAIAQATGDYTPDLSSMMRNYLSNFTILFAYGKSLPGKPQKIIHRRVRLLCCCLRYSSIRWSSGSNDLCAGYGNRNAVHGW